MQIVESYAPGDRWVQRLLPWIVCFSASLFFFYEFIQGNMFASIADNIMHDFHVQADKMAYLSSTYYLANVLFLFIAGFVFDHLSTKKTLLLAMCFCVAGTFLLAHTHSFYVAMLCRFITGIGSAFCFLGPIRLASRWFPPQRMAMVTGAIITMAMTGGMLAQYPLAKLVGQVGWREGLVDVGWLGVVMLIMMFLGVVDKAPQDNHAISRITKPKVKILAIAKQAYLNLQTLKAALYTSLMNMGIAVFGAMMGSLYLVQRLGITKEEAAAVNLMLFLGTVLGGPIIGWCSDKMKRRVVPMFYGCIASFAVLMCILFAPVSVSGMKVLFFLLGFFTSAQVISYALVAESSPREMTATAVSMVSILTQGGYIVYQNLFSYLLVQHGEMQMVNGVPTYSLADYQYAALILPIGLCLAGLTLFRLKETNGQARQD